MGLNVQRALDDFGKFIVTQAKTNLSKKKHNDTNSLYSSLKHRMQVHKNSIELSIYANHYATFVDKGVKGFRSSKKAPNSPFQFGTGTGKKGGLTEAIDGWVKRKRFQFRDKKGKFLSYEQTAFTIRRSIWNTGLPTTDFLTRPFKLAWAKLPEEIIEAYALDVDDLLDSMLNNI